MGADSSLMQQPMGQLPPPPPPPPLHEVASETMYGHCVPSEPGMAGHSMGLGSEDMYSHHHTSTHMAGYLPAPPAHGAPTLVPVTDPSYSLIYSRYTDPPPPVVITDPAGLPPPQVIPITSAPGTVLPPGMDYIATRVEPPSDGYHKLPDTQDNSTEGSGGHEDTPGTPLTPPPDAAQDVEEPKTTSSNSEEAAATASMQQTSQT